MTRAALSQRLMVLPLYATEGLFHRTIVYALCAVWTWLAALRATPTRANVFGAYWLPGETERTEGRRDEGYQENAS